MGEYDFKCTHCHKRPDPYDNKFSRTCAFISKLYLCYPKTFDNTGCSGKRICNCEHKNPKECQLYLMLQRLNDPKNKKFHQMTWNHVGEFDRMICDEYSKKHDIHAEIVLCEECYFKNYKDN
jgi:hypothetical protein